MDKTPLRDDREMSTAERHGALKVLAVSAALAAVAVTVVAFVGDVDWRAVG